MEYTGSCIGIKSIYLPHQDQESALRTEPGSTDVIVITDSGKKYVASFFSYVDVEERRRQNKRTGEFMDGLYFWDKNMVIVEECTLSTIEKIVQHMIDEGEFQEAFKLL